MLRLLRSKKAQSVAEYVIVLGLVVGAVVAMQTYVKRGLQGRIKDVVDKTDDAGTGVFQTAQYEPYYMETNFDVNRGSNESETMNTGGDINRTTASDSSQRTGTSKANKGRASNE
jgi:hypothetical protein